MKRQLIAVLAVALLVGPAQGSVAHAAQVAPVVTRPVAELFGVHPRYGFAGAGVNTATGNYSRVEVDLPFATNLLAWQRTYNSLDSGVGAFGPGWTAGFSAHLVSFEDVSVALHDDDGRVSTFVPDNAGGYVRPQEVDADLIRNTDGTFVLRYLSGLIETFDATGRGTGRSIAGEHVTLEYDESGRLAKATHSAGYQLTVGYDENGRITTVTAGDERVVRYGYAADGSLSSVTGPGGLLGTYQVGASGRIEKATDADDRTVVSIAYDDAGRVRHQDLGAGGAIDLSYDTDSGATTVTDGNGQRVVYQHDSSGRATSLTDPAGGTVRQTFDGSGRVTGVSTAGGLEIALTYDGRGNVTSRAVSGARTTYTYDGQDRRLTATNPSGSVTRYSYTGDDRTPSQVTDPNGASSTYTVTAGLVTEATDATGARTAYSYDERRRLVTVTDPIGGVTRYGHDGAGRTTSVTAPSGRTSRLDYDAAGRVVASTDPAGQISRYRYSAAGLLLETTDPTGAVSTNRYDVAGRRTGVTDPLGRTTTYAYAADGNLAATTNATDATSQYGYDPFGRLSQVTAPSGAQLRYGYDADGRRVEQVAPAGTTVTAYDNRGNVTASTDAAGRRTSYEYDADGRLVMTTDPVGAVTTVAYDSAGRVVARTNPLGAVTRYTYDAAGRLLTITDPLSHVTRYGYDAAGRVITMTNALGGVTGYAYDVDGRKTSQTSPAGLVVRFEYNANGQLTRAVDPRGGVTSYGYNARGQQTSATVPGGAVRRMEYDAGGQLTRVINGNGAATSYSYDGAGRLLTLTEPNGSVVRFGYDAAGRQTSSTDPLGRVTQQTYDASGNLVATVDPAGHTLRMEYDAVGELVKQTGEDATTVSYTYTGAGRRASMIDSTGTTTYTHDLAGQLTSYRLPDGSVYSMAYDAAGRRVSLKYPDKRTIGYRYDDVDRLTGVSDPKAGEAKYTVDPDGLLLNEDLPDHRGRAYTYAGGLLSRFTETIGKIKLRDTKLTRDAEGRVIKQSDLDGTQEFRYDPAGQLVAVTGPRHDDDIAIGYDVNGNRVRFDADGKRSTFSYDAADQLVASEAGGKRVDFTYDPSGRLLTRTGRDGTLAITYDSLGRAVTTALTEGHKTATQRGTFNGDGLLTTLSTDGSDERSVHHQDVVRLQWSSGDSVAQVLNQDGKTDFVYGYGRLFADSEHRSATFSRDAYGSAIQTPDTSDWVRDTGYDAFGVANGSNHGSWLSGPGLAPPRFGYRGELTINDTLYLRARSYDPTVGRFTSRDPISVLVGQTTPASPYHYANNDPVDLVDPLGTFALFDAIAALIAFLTDPGIIDHCWDNPDPGNSSDRHDKCFQGKGPLRTRGYIPRDCLNADQGCLEGLWNLGRKECAAQAVTINELNKRREGWWDRFQDDQLSMGTELSRDVDWEVGDTNTDAECGFIGFRIDIVTNERNIFEVKRYEGESTTSAVDAQLAGYIFTANHFYGINFINGTELQDWASAFEITDWWEDLLGLSGTLVYVWGQGNPPGHVYFSEDEEKVPAGARVKGENKHEEEKANENRCDWCIPVPPIIRVPIVV